jgi:metal-sulfur cluster biosynthetic enzyme
MKTLDVTVEQVWGWLGAVADPEIPVISVVDLGIVRDVAFEDGACVVTITPTYSGCPAMQVIADSVKEALQAHGLEHVRIVSRQPGALRGVKRVGGGSPRRSAARRRASRASWTSMARLMTRGRLLIWSLSR